jgi:hypothetical protein
LRFFGFGMTYDLSQRHGHGPRGVPRARARLGDWSDGACRVMQLEVLEANPFGFGGDAAGD